MYLVTQPPYSTAGHPVAQLCARFGAKLDDVGDAATLRLWSATDTDLIDLVQTTETQIRRLQAVQTAAVSEARRRDLAKTQGATSTTSWLAGVLTVERRHAGQIDKLAAALDVGHDATVAAFAAGSIDVSQARVVAEAVDRLPDELGPQVRDTGEQLMLQWAGEHPANVLAGLGAHLLARLAPDRADQIEADALAKAEARELDRRNSLTDRVDHRGRIRLNGDLDPEAWAVVRAGLEPFAKPAPAMDRHGATTDARQDPRTHGQRQADALLELCRRALSADDAPTSGGFPAHVAITIDFETLLAQSGVGLLDTGDTISAAAVRRLACDATIIPVLLGTDGVPLDVGRAIRVFMKELRRAVELRDGGCAFPGCERPMSWCQVHHIVHRLFGGRTSLDNGVLLCRAHHRLIHRGEWMVRLGRDRRPEFLPPTYVDPHRTPRHNTYHRRN